MTSPPDSTAPLHCPEVDPRDTAELAALFYKDLRGIAQRLRRRHWDEQTPQTTVLIHDAYLRLEGRAWSSEAHFLNTAAVAMRQAIVDAARNRLSLKRGGDHVIEPLPESDALVDPAGAMADDQLLGLDQALVNLGGLDPGMLRIVECRYFAGYSVAETARILGTTERTVYRRWERARLWLKHWLETGSQA